MNRQIFSSIRLDAIALYVLMVITLPLSVKLFFPPANTEVIYPAEVFIGLLAVLFFYNILFGKGISFYKDKRFLRHPLNLLVFFYLIANASSVIFSTMHLVSLKALIVKFCYILVFYFMIQPLLKSSHDNFFRMLKIYTIALCAVIIYSLFCHYQFGLKRQSASLISIPFFNDHTIYGAALAFIIPALCAFIFHSKLFEVTRYKQILFFLILSLLLTGLYFSFSRAAWISVIVCLFFFLLIISGLRFWGFVLLAITTLTLVWINFDSLTHSFKQNKNNSYDNDAGVYEQVLSVTSFTNDFSNAERLNRWSCAWRMFLDKPLLGFGPGTYQFQYFTYQKKEEMTLISITEPIKSGTSSYSWSPEGGLRLPLNMSAFQGSGGTTHSQYFLELSESGIFSFLTFVGFFVISLFIALKIFSKSHDKKIKVIAIVALLGLITYFVHGLFNNFLDDCKIAFLFWSSLSVLAVIDDKSRES